MSKLRLRLAAFISVIALGLGVGVYAVTTTAVLNPASDLQGKTLVTAEGNRTITGTWSFSVPLRANPGTTNAPGLVSTSDQTTGWQLSASSIGGSINATQRFLLDTTGLTIYGNQVVDTTGTIPSTGLASSLRPSKETLWIPASAMVPTITNGATGPATAELTAGNPNITSMSFVNGSQKNAQFAIAFPKQWNLGTVTYQAFWTGTAAGAGTTIWGFQCLAAADGATTDAAFGTAVEVTDTFLAVKQIHVAPESAAVTISGAAADTHTTCQIYRKGGTDTRAAASLLLGVKLFFTINAFNDN